MKLLIKKLDKSTIRVFKTVDGKAVGLGMTVKTLLDFDNCSHAEALKLAETVIRANWSVVKWLRK